MQSKRKEFLDRLLKVADINEELIDLGQPRAQPVFARRIRIFQLGQCQIDLPKAQEQPVSKYATRVLTVSRKHKQSQVGERQTRSAKAENKPRPATTHFMSLVQRKNSIEIAQNEQRTMWQSQTRFNGQFESRQRCSSAKQTQRSNPEHAGMANYGLRSELSVAHSQSHPPTTIDASESNDKVNHVVFGPKHSTEPTIRPKTCRYRSQGLLSSASKPARSVVEKEKQAKLAAMRELHKNYARPFIPPPRITAKSYLVCELMQDQLRVCVCLNSKTSQEVASLTKIMTCTVVLEQSSKMGWNIDQEEVVISRFEAHTPGTTASLRAGQIYTVKQLLYGLMLPSGNDASLALAAWCGCKHLLHHASPLNMALDSPKPFEPLSPATWSKKAGYERFLELMNLKAKELKMAKTCYANSHGLVNPRNKSTAYDVALLSQHALTISTFRQIVSCPHFECILRYIQAPRSVDSAKDGTVATSQGSEGGGKEKNRTVRWENTHKLLHSRPQQYLGIKTGVTVNAGPCLCSLVTVDRREFLIVVLGCGKMGLRFKETEILKKWLYRSEGIAKRVKKLNAIKRSTETQQELSECESWKGEVDY